MVQKVNKKEQLRQQIVKAAQIYSQSLAGKIFLYIYENKYFEILFKTDRFLHLTGVESNLSAKSFYKNAKNGNEDLLIQNFMKMGSNVNDIENFVLWLYFQQSCSFRNRVPAGIRGDLESGMSFEADLHPAFSPHKFKQQKNP